MSDGSRDFVNQFESRVREAVVRCGISPADMAARGIPLGAAVSGGADSTALLYSLAHILRDFGARLAVVTVNHHIRSDAEACGDAEFVAEQCAFLRKSGCDVSCAVKELERGLAARTAEKRGKGIEEAARYLRYGAFAEFAAETGVSFLCLAHNQNDQLETVLMRFLQGGGASAAGIRPVRGIYARPLLDISRADIERYLAAQRIPWRTDSTNCDESYFRNRIRGKLLPFLDGFYPGWRVSVLAGARRLRDDGDAVQSCISGTEWRRDGGGTVSMPLSEFNRRARAVRTRLLYAAFPLVRAEKRVPYRFVEKILAAAVRNEGGASEESAAALSARNGDAASEGRGAVVSAAACGVAVEIGNGVISVKKLRRTATERGFFAIIEAAGRYELPCGTLSVTVEDGKAALVLENGARRAALKQIPVPFCIRSLRPGDRVRAADGGGKKVADVLSAWHIGAGLRDGIPLVQELVSPGQEIVCVWGGACGFRDWIVRG